MMNVRGEWKQGHLYFKKWQSKVSATYNKERGHWKFCLVYLVFNLKFLELRQTLEDGQMGNTKCDYTLRTQFQANKHVLIISHLGDSKRSRGSFRSLVSKENGTLAFNIEFFFFSLICFMSKNILWYFYLCHLQMWIFVYTS